MSKSTQAASHLKNRHGLISGSKPAASESLQEVLGRIGRSDPNKRSPLMGRLRLLLSETEQKWITQTYPEKPRDESGKPKPDPIYLEGDTRFMGLGGPIREVLPVPSRVTTMTGESYLRKLRVKAVAVVGATVWSALSYASSPLPDVIPVTPSRALHIPLVDRVFDSQDSSKNASDKPPTPTTTTIPTGGAVPTTTAAGAAPASPNSTTTFPPQGATTGNTLGLPTIPPTTINIVVPTVLPENPTDTKVFVVGEMYCNALVDGVQIQDGEFAFSALRRASDGEPLDDIDNSAGFADEVWNAVQALPQNGGSIKNAPDTVFTGLNDCHNYDTINNGHIA